jgi:hypothetical protein
MPGGDRAASRTRAVERRPDEGRHPETVDEAGVGPAGLLGLQQSAGNAAVAQLVARQPTATADPDASKTKRPGSGRPADQVLTNTAASKTGKVSNAYGQFTYSVTKNAGSNGCSFSLSFKAFSPEVSATKITFIQTVKGHKAGGAAFYLNNDSTYYAPFDPAGSGLYTDHLKGETDPFYNYEDKTRTDETTGTTGPTTTTMTDAPRIASIAGERGQTFETAPFALSGTDKGEFFGTLTWGWDIDSAGNFKLQDVAAHDDITTDFGAALRKFIERQHALTKDGTTPAPVSVDLPTDMCRLLNTGEKATLKPVADFVKAKANARVYVIARYGDPSEAAMARDNATTVQSELTAGGVADNKIHFTYLQQTGVKKGTSPVEVTVINT